jgi:hypothetical protein
MSKASLPLSTHGYFSDPGNFNYFAECADSWLKIPPKSKLDPGIEKTLRLVFESASQLGLFEGAGQRLTWKQKLWTIGAHWGIDQEPWLYDEFGDAPMALDMHQVSDRLDQEVEALQAAKSAASSLAEFVQPTTRPRTPPYEDPYPAENLSNFNHELTQAPENILREVDDIHRQQGPSTTAQLVPYQSSQEDPTPEALAIESPCSRAVRENVYMALAEKELEHKYQEKQRLLEHKVAKELAELAEARERIVAQAIHQEKEVNSVIAELVIRLEAEKTAKEKELAKVLAKQLAIAASEQKRIMLDFLRSQEAQARQKDSQVKLVLQQAEEARQAQEIRARLAESRLEALEKIEKDRLAMEKLAALREAKLRAIEEEEQDLLLEEAWSKQGPEMTMVILYTYVERERVLKRWLF